MPKTKRSFLQRLIGKEDAEAEPRIKYQTGFNQNRNFESKKMDYSAEDFSEAGVGFNRGFEDVENREDYQQYDKLDQAEKVNKNQAGQEMAEGDIVSDQEGQLTIDVYQTDSDIVIKSTIAGVKPENLDVQINNDMVTIKGERIQEEEVSNDDYYYQECYWGAFSRSIILPVDIQASKSEASLKNGILTIRLPKASSAKARKIQVRGF
ncbi:MAG: Hsp20 family protein [Candidatus Moranbacteria bacterium]|nr:Hsp20 family protein [Candidatus Moranbacteria bacterium]